MRANVSLRVALALTAILAMLACLETVRPYDVASVEVSPAEVTLPVGGHATLAAEALDASGEPVLFAAVSWAASDPGIASVSSEGEVLALAPGITRVVATTEGFSDTALVTVIDEAPVASAVLVGAGDIADCTVTQDEATATLVDGIAGTVFVAGDNAYPDGSASDYADCYVPTWGRHKARTYPVVGNHEYQTPGASGYYEYFGPVAGDPSKGYYSYDLGAWHVIILNSNISMSVGSAQEQWLRADLAAHPAVCTLAMAHHPRFSSGYHSNSTALQPLWQALYDAGADVVIAGHDHNYERFAPQTPTGTRDDERGLREFVIGTGGRALRVFGTIKPNSEVRNSDTHGVMKFTLHATSYEWQFIPIAGKTFTDVGSDSCH
jgi:hypothetical protein